MVISRYSGQPVLKLKGENIVSPCISVCEISLKVVDSIRMNIQILLSDLKHIRNIVVNLHSDLVSTLLSRMMNTIPFQIFCCDVYQIVGC